MGAGFLPARVRSHADSVSTTFPRVFIVPIRIRMPAAVLLFAVVLGLEVVRVARADDAAPEKSAAEQQAAAERLKEMESLAQSCRLSREVASQKAYVLEPKPLLRWSNPISGVVDGSMSVDSRRAAGGDGRSVLGQQGIVLDAAMSVAVSRTVHLPTAR